MRAVTTIHPIISRLSSIVPAVFAAAFLPGLICLRLLAGVLEANEGEIQVGPALIAVFSGVFLASWLLVAGIFLAARSRPPAAWVARGLLWLGVNIVAWDVTITLLPWLENSLPVAAAIEFAILAISALLLFKLPLAPTFIVFAVVAVSILVDDFTQVRKEIGRWVEGVPITPPQLTEGVRLGAMLAGETQPLEDAVDLAGLSAGPGAVVSSGGPLHLTLQPDSQKGVVLVPFGLPDGTPGSFLVAVKLRVLRGAVDVEVTTEQGNRLPVRRMVRPTEQAVEVYLPVPPEVKRGQIRLGNAMSLEGEVTQVQVLDLAVRSSPATPQQPTVAAADLAEKGNVYHVIFDGFQRELYQHLIDRDPSLTPAGFTFYEGFRINYFRTMWSNASVLMSRFYEPGYPIKKWRNDVYQGGFWRTLWDAGVDLHLYPPYHYWCFRHARRCTTMEFEKRELRARIESLVAIDLWFLRLLPVSLKGVLREVVKGQSAIQLSEQWDYAFSVTQALGYQHTGAISPKHKGLYTVRAFERMLAEEASRPAHGQYTFVHVIVPHPPYIFDSECNYVAGQPGWEHRPERIFSMGECALLLLRKLVDRLKELDRYDSSMIVVHADTGKWWHPDPLREQNMMRFSTFSPREHFPGVDVNTEDTAKLPSYQVETRASALLLVKYPGSDGYETQAGSAQAIDLAPTILRHFGLGTSSLKGLPLQDLANHPSRPYFGYVNNKIPNGKEPANFGEFVKTDGPWVFRRHIPTTR